MEYNPFTNDLCVAFGVPCNECDMPEWPYGTIQCYEDSEEQNAKVYARGVRYVYISSKIMCKFTSQSF